MTPYYSQDGITIFLGDCRDILPTLAPGDANALVTDPPFGIDFSGATWTDEPVDYCEFMQAWLPQAQRIVGGGPMFVWQALPTIERWHTWFPPGYRVMAICKGFVQFRPTPVQYSWDPVVFWGELKGEPDVRRKDWYVQALAPFGANRPHIDHPCPKPLEATGYVVSLASQMGDTILEPFAGSGTTLIAAKRLGRKVIAVEKREEYAEIAANRLAQTVLPLPDAEPERATTLALEEA